MESKKALINFCNEIGKNRLFVQGAGGNVSYKDSNLLYIKASGKRIGDAKKEEIFVPVDLKNLNYELDRKNFSITPRVDNSSSLKLKPSIETIMHALMPEKFVLHLHAIDPLAILVRQNSKKLIAKLVGKNFNYLYIQYCKPGSNLAESIAKALIKKPSDVIFLENHGIVIGADSVNLLHERLNNIINIFKFNLNSTTTSAHIISNEKNIKNFYLLEDFELSELVFDDFLYDNLDQNWVLYPDHVVFLGEKPVLFDSLQSFKDCMNQSQILSPIVFVKSSGIFVTSEFSNAQLEQLKCYYDVLKRQKTEDILKPLTQSQVFELVNWDAEKYRINLSKD
jgi:rhamnose utilization protein RhaD (predicted bifunctional aldolase and dehydrogenase)